MYENILNALKSDQQGLSYEDQVQNYTLFNSLMKKGVKLQDLIDRANAPKEPAIDESLFSAMENAVSDDLNVVSAKKSQEREIKRVLNTLYRNDPGYREAEKAYRDAVIKAYTEKRGDPRAEMTKVPGVEENGQTSKPPDD